MASNEQASSSWHADIRPADPPAPTDKTEVWFQDRRTERDHLIASALRNFSVSRQFLTDTRFSSSERLIRFFEGVTASMQPRPSQDAFRFTTRSFESVIRFGANKSLEKDPLRWMKDEEEAKLLTLQAYHNLAVIHHRRWLQLWEDRTGPDARYRCNNESPPDACEDAKLREEATLCYESAHRYYECVLQNEGWGKNSAGGNGYSHTSAFFKRPQDLVQQFAKNLVDDLKKAEEVNTIATEELTQAKKEHMEKDHIIKRSSLKEAENKSNAAKDGLNKAKEKINEIQSYATGLLRRRVAVLLLSSLGLLELILQGRLRWKFGEGTFPLLPAAKNPPSLNFGALLRLTHTLAIWAEELEASKAMDDDSEFPREASGLLEHSLNDLQRVYDPGVSLDLSLLSSAPTPSEAKEASEQVTSNTEGWVQLWQWVKKHFPSSQKTTPEQLRLQSEERADITAAIMKELERICLLAKKLKEQNKFNDSAEIRSRLEWAPDKATRCLDNAF